MEDEGISKETPSIQKTVASRKYKGKRVIILGDSHARSCAANLKQKVDRNFQVIGYVKPSAETSEIVKSATSEIKELTKSDVIIVLGGTNDIGRNNAYKGIKTLTKFVQEYHHTNVILTSATHRHELPEW